MKLKEFMALYSGNASISINGYCEEEHYDYYLLPDEDEEDFSGDNPGHYIPTCLAREPWWDEVKDCEVERFGIIGGGCYKVELCIHLKE